MSMIGVNLVPRPRIEARHRARTAAAWIKGGAAYATVLAATCITAHTLWGGEPENLASQQQQLTRQIEDAQRRLAQLDGELAASRKRVEANHAVINQPDWSILLALMAQTLDNRVMLSGCWFESMPLDDATTIQTAANRFKRTDGFPVHVTGYGKDLQAVSAYVLRLEASRLYDEVRLISTRSEPIPSTNTQAIAFEVSCFLKLTGAERGLSHE